METAIDVTLLALLGLTGIALLRVYNLVTAAMLLAIYSLLCASLFTTLDAVDVAFTEAAVGAGVSTVLLLGTLALVGREEKRPLKRQALPLIMVVVTGAALVYGIADIPPFGAPDNPAQQHVAPVYLQESEAATGIPNVVTSVLTSYRGYDTLGEVTVIFTAAVGVLLLLATGRGRGRGPDDG
ncbi:MAG: DUF4040 domain-containing protein [Gemmatimonadota bacterium]|nr:DUF4040 domain-containing protein [Gemmatimonadota bacterium]